MRIWDQIQKIIAAGDEPAIEIEPHMLYFPPDRRRGRKTRLGLDKRKRPGHTLHNFFTGDKNRCCINPSCRAWRTILSPDIVCSEECRNEALVEYEKVVFLLRGGEEPLHVKDVPDVTRFEGDYTAWKDFPELLRKAEVFAERAAKQSIADQKDIERGKKRMREWAYRTKAREKAERAALRRTRGGRHPPRLPLQP